MSSSNRVRVAFIEETTYGETPVAGNFSTARFTSEELSGSPDTVESQQIRTDRMSSGQVVTGLSLGGNLNFELAKETALERFMASAMMKEWVAPSAVTVHLNINFATKEITRSAGDWNAQVKVGDMLTLAGFTNTANNTQVMITAISSATVIKFTSSESLITESRDAWVTGTPYEVDDEIYYTDGKIYKCLLDHTSDADFAVDLAALRWEEISSGTSFKVADYLEIGSDKISFSMEKAFLDLSNKGIVYKGMLANEMALNVAYGAIITGNFNFVGNDYQAVDQATDFITNARTIHAAATTNSMNGSVDMPFLASSAVGVLDKVNFCIQEVGISLSNNLTPQNCIGKIAPTDYTEGTASIEINLNSYLSDENWDILGKKLTQEPFALGFAIKNLEGFYGFYLPAVQVSMDDPTAGGQNQDVFLNMTGMAKVGALGESALRIYRA